jgi:hypothetical protein
VCASVLPNCDLGEYGTDAKVVLLFSDNDKRYWTKTPKFATSFSLNFMF